MMCSINFFKSESSLKMKEYIRLNKNKFSWKNYIEGIWELTDESQDTYFNIKLEWEKLFN